MITVAAMALAALPALADGGGGDFLVYEVTASEARRNREVIGPVTGSIRGVPAEPVDSFVWDGEGSERVRGHARLEIDPVSNTGFIRAFWTDRHGFWSLRQTAFAPPPHATGLRVGSSSLMTESEEDGDPVTTNVYLHGDTASGGPVLPTVFNLITTWGPGEVRLNGRPFKNPFDGPAPRWVVHTMTTVGVRGEDGTVRTTSGGIYNPMASDDGARDEDDMEFHVVFHDAPGPETTNIPPAFSFFYHVMFEDVTVEVHHGD